MQCRKLTLRFKRPLTKQEDENLTAYFKGLIERMKVALREKGKSIAKLGWLNANVNFVNSRIEALLTPMVIDGKQTTHFDQYFTLDFYESNPTEYYFIYPHQQEIMGFGNVAKVLKEHNINPAFTDEYEFKQLIHEAGLRDVLQELRFYTIERN